MVRIPITTNGTLSWMDESDRPATQGMNNWRRGLEEGTARLTDKAIRWMTHELRKKEPDRTGRISPSGIYTCPRRQMLAYAGHKPQFSESTLLFMEMGRWGHLRWQTAGLSEGFLVRAEVAVTAADPRIRGTMDGILADGSGLEFKTTSERNYTIVRIRGASSDYLSQVRLYMHLSGIDVFSLVYESRDSGEFFETRVRDDPASRSAMDRTLDTMTAFMDAFDRDGSLPPVLPACAARSGKEYRSCPMRDTCLPYDPGPPPAGELTSA